MIQSLYSGASALHVLNRQHEQTADNLANINTAGHRRAQFTLAERNSGGNLNAMGAGPELDAQSVDFTIGRREQTGRTLDVALSDDGFFVVDGQDEELYTRDGRFYRDSESGNLVDVHGNNIVGEVGPISIDPNVRASEINIGADGAVYAGSREVGRLKIVAFENNQNLVPASKSRFALGPNSVTKESNASVIQGSKELSNVNPVTELVALIMGSRQFEAVQRATKSISEAIQQNIRG